MSFIIETTSLIFCSFNEICVISARNFHLSLIHYYCCHFVPWSYKKKIGNEKEEKKDTADLKVAHHCVNNARSESKRENSYVGRDVMKHLHTHLGGWCISLFIMNDINFISVSLIIQQNVRRAASAVTRQVQWFVIGVAASDESNVSHSDRREWETVTLARDEPRSYNVALENDRVFTSKPVLIPRPTFYRYANRAAINSYQSINTLL
jgi:hypothetical protein